MEYTDGNCKYKVKKIATGSGVLPGTILAFSGNFSGGYPIDKTTGNADTTWHLCDGTNGTPDLRGRFILGASSSHEAGTTGGEEANQLTEQELPKVTVTSTGTTSDDGQHSHNIVADSDQKDGWKRDAVERTTEGEYSPVTRQTEKAGLHHHTVTTSGTFGGGQAHNNMPPYYTLAFIIKI